MPAALFLLDPALYAAGYGYACAGGMAIVRLVLDVVPVSAQPAKGGIAVSATELARGRIIGVLERARWRSRWCCWASTAPWDS